MVGRKHGGVWRDDRACHVAIVRYQVGERRGLEEAIDGASDTDPPRVDRAVWTGAAWAGAQQTAARPRRSEDPDDLLERDALRRIDKTKSAGGAPARGQYSGGCEPSECFREIVRWCPHCRCERRYGDRARMAARELENGS